MSKPIMSIRTTPNKNPQSDNSKSRNDRHVVRRLFGPAARHRDDLGGGGVGGDVGGRPDVVEATATVRGLPVERAVAPPGAQLLAVGQVLAHEVRPAVIGAQQRVERYGLARREH